MPATLLKRHWPILALIALNLLIASLVVRDYGVSADEPGYIIYSHQSLSAYRSWIDASYVPSFGRDVFRYYGPASALPVALAASFFLRLFPGLFEPDFWHFSYFVDLQIAGLCLYALARRWFSEKTAFALTALFVFQPLLWGHAFINPKDIPFLMAFSVAVTLGLWAIDRLPREDAPPALTLQRLAESWAGADLRRKKIAIGGTAVCALFVAGIFLGWREVIGLVNVLVRLAVSGGSPLLASLLHLFVSGSSLQPVENYVAKALRISEWLRAGSVILSILLALFLYRPLLPDLFGWLRPGSFKDFLRRCLGLFRNPSWMLAGLALGFATSTRVLGPWAGVLVVFYLGRRASRLRFLPALTVYGLAAVLGAILAWPFLWPDPAGRFLESLKIMSTFPWQGKVLFDGVQYYAGQLPVRYLPVLLSLQLTEPVLLLFGLGLLRLGWDFSQKRKVSGLAGLFFGWFLLPLVIMILTHRPLYDNFRQLLFLLPPVFLVCGLGFELIFERFPARLAFVIALAAALLPGGIALIRLHPYQYVYYNSLAGGVAGAAGRFDMDYWVSSYPEAMRFLNQNAPQGSKIMAWTFSDVARLYARPDLVVAPQNTQDVGRFDYAIISARGDKHLTVFPDAPVIFTISREGVVFSVVKDLAP